MSYAKSIDGLNIKLSAGNIAPSVDSLDMLLSVSTEIPQGLVIFSPIDNAINVSITPLFKWSDTNDYPAYKIQIADNAEYTNAITAYITEKDYTQTEALLNGTNYHWKVIGGNVTDRPAIVPDSGEPVVASMTVWDATTDPAPIYVYDNGGTVIPKIEEAATELSRIIGVSSGKTAPQVSVVSDSFNFPSRCIKVGFPNSLNQREEIQIKYVDGQPLELTGVDEYDPAFPDYTDQVTETNWMNQAGTYNAVMTFIQDHIGVVWGWMNDLGEAVPSKTELKIPVMDYTHTPSAISRTFLSFSRPGNDSPYSYGKKWLEKNRGFYSIVPDRGHSFTTYYDRFHPDANQGAGDSSIFALQPDGSRNGYPSNDPDTNNKWAKMEVGDEALDTKWLQVNVAEAIDITTGNPNLQTFSANFNDSHTRGHSVDIRAREMDYPDQGRISAVTSNSVTSFKTKFTTNEHTDKMVAIYEIQPGTNLLGGLVERIEVQSNTEDTLTFKTDLVTPVDTSYYFYVEEDDVQTFNCLGSGGTTTLPIMTDRDVAFGKRLLSKIENTYPEKYVSVTAYGPTRPAPKREGPADKLLVINTANDFNDPNNTNSGNHRVNMDNWLSAWGKNQIWRANLGFGHGHQRGMWLSQLNLIGNRFKTIIPQGCTGFAPDAFWESWSTQWPMYYMISQLLWDHTKKINDIMDKAYDTLFGDAAPYIKSYYEKIGTRIEANLVHNLSIAKTPVVFDDDFLTGPTNSLQVQIDSAKNAVESGTSEHERVLWVEAGFEWSKAVIQSCKYWLEYNAPATETDTINLATQANAIEDGTNATTGWTQMYNSTLPSVVSDPETENGFAFFFDTVNSDSRGLLRTGDPLGGFRTPGGRSESGSLNSLTDTDASWQLDEFNTHILYITGGTDEPVNEYKRITSNTADTLNLSGNFTTAINTCYYTIAEGLSTSGTINSLTDNTKNWANGEHVGKALLIRYGTNQYEYALITSNTSDTVTTRESFTSTFENNSVYDIVPMYLITLKVKHTGIGGDWRIDNAWGAPQDYAGVRIKPEMIGYRDIQFIAFGGDYIRIRELNSNNDGNIYVADLRIKSAEPVDKESIETVWDAHNFDARVAATDSKWGPFSDGSNNNIRGIPLEGSTPPISGAVTRFDSNRLPNKTSAGSLTANPDLI